MNCQPASSKNVYGNSTRCGCRDLGRHVRNENGHIEFELASNYSGKENLLSPQGIKYSKIVPYVSISEI